MRVDRKRVCVGPRTEEMSSARRTELVDSLQMGDGSWTEDQHQLLTSLVLEWDDVFAGKGDRGEVEDVCHDISTGDSPPLKQPARHAPFALMPEQLVKKVIYSW